MLSTADSSIRNKVFNKQVKFLFCFTNPPAVKVFNNFSLKQGSLILISILCVLTFNQFFLDLINKSDVFLTCIKYIVYSALNITCLVNSLKTRNDHDYKKRYINYILLIISFGVHCFFIAFALFFGRVNFFLSLYYLFGRNFFFSYFIPNAVFLLLEYYSIFIFYSITKLLAEGGESIVDGKDYKEEIKIDAENINNKDIMEKADESDDSFKLGI